MAFLFVSGSVNKSYKIQIFSKKDMMQTNLFSYKSSARAPWA